MLCRAESYQTLYNGNKKLSYNGNFPGEQLQWNLDFLNFQGERKLFEKLESLRNRVKLLTAFDWGGAAPFGLSHREIQKTEGSRDLDSKCCSSTCMYFNSEWIYSTDWYENNLQVEDYRNSSMIDCKMGISADTLVLVHSSTKVSNEIWHNCFTCVLRLIAQDSSAERFSVDSEVNLGHTLLESLLCSEHALHKIVLAILTFMVQFLFILFHVGSHI